MIINMNDGEQQHIELPRKPTGMTVSEDESKVLRTCSLAEVTLIDLAENNISDTYELPFIPFGVAIGENGWFYASAKNHENGSELLAFNTISGTYKTPYDVMLSVGIKSKYSNSRKDH